MLAALVLLGCGDGPAAPGGDTSVRRLELDPPSATAAALGQTLEFTARAFDGNGARVPAVALTWASSDTTVLVSEGNGRFRTRANGAATVAVRVTGNARVPERTAPVLVRQQPSRLELSADSLDLYAIGHTVMLVARLVDALGNELTGPVPFVWQSANPGIATVDATGTVRATGDGVVAISAHAGPLIASIATRVSATLRIAGCLSSTDVSRETCRSLSLPVGAGR